MLLNVVKIGASLYTQILNLGMKILNQKVDWLLTTCFWKKEDRSSNEVCLIKERESRRSQVRRPPEFKGMCPSRPPRERAGSPTVLFEVLRVVWSVQKVVNSTLRMWVLLQQRPEPEPWYHVEQVLWRRPTEMGQGHPDVLLAPQHNKTISRFLLYNE